MKTYRISLLITTAFLSIACAGCGDEEKKASLSSIAITSAPTKVEYKAGEFFDKTGMVVTASYDDGTSAVVEDYTYSPMTALATNNYSVTINHNGFECYQNIKVTNDGPTPPGPTPDPGDYYGSITAQTGNELLVQLRDLNLKKRVNVFTYKKLNSYYKYTDYDPVGAQIDSTTGLPYNNRLLSFYSGISTTSYNKEHVWPNSRGGGEKGTAGTPHPDADLYMPRPTISAENSDRGNSVYVEGMCHSANGWDPVTAFKDTIGVYQSIRGECARIIFYCMTVNSKLVLNESTSCDGNNMGKLSTLLKWNLENPVNPREINRQKGVQYFQGNRNAFVDHPEYACRIWGATNSATRSICGM